MRDSAMCKRADGNGGESGREWWRDLPIGIDAYTMPISTDTNTSTLEQAHNEVQVANLERQNLAGTKARGPSKSSPCSSCALKFHRSIYLYTHTHARTHTLERQSLAGTKACSLIIYII